MNWKNISFLLLFSITLASVADVQPMIYRSMYGDRDVEYLRGTFMIVIPQNQLMTMLDGPDPYNFLKFKRSQGYDVVVVSMADAGLTTANQLKAYIHDYADADPLLEYVLLVGDINGDWSIPTFHVTSINEPEEDVTDYPYCYSNNEPGSPDYDVLSPRFLLGRWSIRDQLSLLYLVSRTIEYYRQDQVQQAGTLDYLDRALLAAGNYATNDGQEIPPSSWPVTPVWTSYWLLGLLEDYGYAQIDTAFFHMNYQIPYNPLIANAWNNGVGVVTYRGWGNSHGWHVPSFTIEDIHQLENGWKLPIVFSCVCNTGDFGADEYDGPVSCWGEALLTSGTPSNPRGAAAMIGPSDLDTDTKYNNVIFGAMWDAMLDGDIYELGPVLFTGKQALIQEFPQWMNPGEIVEFYHHVYGVLGDPSLPVYIKTPGNMTSSLVESPDLHQSHIATIVTNEAGLPLNNVVAAILLDGELIAKGISTPDGELTVDFDGVAPGSTLDLYLNKPQFLPLHVTLTLVEDDGTPFVPAMYTEFDVQAVLPQGNEYLISGADATMQLEVTNHTLFSYTDVTVQLSESGSSLIDGTFPAAVIDVGPLSTVTTGNVVEGVLSAAAPGERIHLDVSFIIDETVVGDADITVMVGPVASTDPVPHCDYGYWAYDNTDVSYPEAPVYDWVDISEIGTDLNLTDDSHISDVEIGFPFSYFGESYTTVTVSSNGWFSFEDCSIDYFWNFSIPMPLGPNAMVAPFFDDLDDAVESFTDVNGNGQWDPGEDYVDTNGNGEYSGGEPFHIYAWQDSENGRFIVQWDQLPNGETDQFCYIECERETFQAILYDPQVYSTATGDGEILFQYQEIYDLDEDGNFSTIGIESPDQEDGIQYLFNERLSPGASALADGLAIKFTTDGPGEQGCLLGDVTEDEQVDILDIVSIVLHILESTPYSDTQLCAADLTLDEQIDILDIVALVLLILGE